MAKVLEERDFVSVRPEQITKLVMETGALDRASNLAREYVKRAKMCLEELAGYRVPPGSTRRPRFHSRSPELIRSSEFREIFFSRGEP